MKKTFVSLTVLTAFIFAGCSIGDLFVDDVEVHNGLIQKMDAVLLAEENLYNEYWALIDDVDVTPFVESYEAFAEAVEELDTYFSETRFASSQKIFVEEYNDYYKDFIDDYVEYAGEFTEKVREDGYTFEAMESYFEDLDNFTVEFVEMHNTLIDTINVQSDYASEGMGY
jgi:hypothetical protein